ncbi:hypothetical protein A3B60_00320 [Candidatus Peregrinibacteria bacterium RIFCSPLOWO2_01_FULL_39_12]|nr:MAG: hypothetical protein A3I58_00075 [Candidatus Peregrinibacteria bacterium RIFCSPLOWO2_02_FULL_39_10]OGJ42229.1 MAG: hypothetical protein A3B60_00320 [Candidatus Peregrinibacteria bacterium RIFCSPLOWO2_01_FULL_39_12]
MNLREGEQILKIYHHHPTPFVIQLLALMLGIFPFFLILFWMQGLLSTFWYVMSHIIVFLVFVLVITYFSLVFWLDKLIVTNQRVVFINWRTLTFKDESEAFLNDIQDIQSYERGIFSYFWVFDYGRIIIETASSHTTILFSDAPDPEGIRQIIYHLRQQ